MLFGNISQMVVAPGGKEGKAYKAGWYRVINFDLVLEIMSLADCWGEKACYRQCVTIHAKNV